MDCSSYSDSFGCAMDGMGIEGASFLNIVGNPLMLILFVGLMAFVVILLGIYIKNVLT
jgi:hypothetical protein